MPIGLPTSPPPVAHTAAVTDMVCRARTFMDEGGTSLVWDATRRGPGLSPTPVHSTTTTPMPITCSHLVGMLLAGWEYQSTTYVQDVNERTGWYSPLGVEPVRAPIWQAHRCAHHFWRRGRLWLVEDPGTLRTGVVLFFSQHDPESTWTAVLARTARPYFGNVYHTAIYLGGGDILQSTGPSSPTGVWEADLDSLAPTLAWAARPEWIPPEHTSLSVLTDGLESPVTTTL
ncbi:hypothetical protein [Actinomyces wuliandei]|uniref:hypothetical protein n=1 Tax=Actinomyces wuliandei TaxID=2057743 RepID=UPI00111B4B5B|nr:hypothetical protein [Actinomyces wuliandei]